ncbi:ABC transporter substrate-binding protein [Streptomyces sp. NPDC048278]|uniref:ABC transporter substrate-binding protein n=1 Tax=Streptomyces sp. NPDC048278 TaxID=3155809 RepID=UPI00341B4FCC
MPDIPLTLACGDYDRTRALHEGSVRPEGVSLTCLRLPVEEIFFRMARFAEFDAAELSLSSYLLTLDAEARGRFVAIPVFPSRSFRHNGIYLHAGSGIDKPGDLVGRTVGVAEYQLTAAVWIRGILAEHHGVPVDSVRYRTGGLHQPGRVEKIRLDLPESVDITSIPPDRTLSDMLERGEIDALYTPRVPRCFRDGAPTVRRLFETPREVEAEYFRRTGVFPVMHTVVLRREVYEAHPWVAMSLRKAFEEARLDALHDIDDTAALRHMLPWLTEEVRHTRELMGEDYWTYGLDDANTTAVETLTRYSHEQGLARRPFLAAELFAPEALETVLV